MTEAHNQIRINELARELEVKAKVIVELLPELGVTEKKTHSSSVDVAVAEKVRQHFQGTVTEAVPEPAPAPPPAETPAAPKPRVAPTPPAPPAVTRPPAAPVATGPAVAAPAAPVTAHPHPPTAPGIPTAPRAPVSSAPPTTHAPAAATPAAPAAPARSAKVAVAPPAVTTPAPPRVAPPAPRPPRPPAPSAAPKTLRPTVQPPSVRPGAPVPRLPQTPSNRPAPGAPLVQRPAAAGPGAGTAKPGGRPAPGAPRPNVPGRPVRPGEGGRLGQRPTRPTGGGAPQPGRMPGQLPAKPEPGKPIYVRKPEQRGRPLAEKRFEEGERKLHPVRARVAETARRAAPAERAPAPREPREITITEGVTVRELAQKLDVRAKDLLKELVDSGILATINQVLDVPTATTLAGQFNATVTAVPFEQQLTEAVVQETKPEKMLPRAPVVTVMGHVDHGKTSLLDQIRHTNVAEGEAGGITQHIGAYQANMDGKRVVFIDTPGHEAFTRMRARGAKATDIVVLVVAADDGIMPQTREAIDHARAAKVPIVVAINKVDKLDAQPERVKRQLSDAGLMPEEWGGDTVVVEVSAKTGKNFDRLIEMIALVGELRELKANPEAPASGIVLESRVDKGRGPVATVLVQNGTLHVGDFFICGSVYGKVRALFDDRGQPVKKAGPSTPVEVLGLQDVPEAGDQMLVTDEAKARHIAEYRQTKQREASLARTLGARLTLDQLQEQLKAGEVKELPVVLKADVQGSIEVLIDLLPKLATERVKLDVIHASVGAVTETDVLLASASKAIIIAFNIRPERKATDLAQHENVEIRTYAVIYDLVDELKKLLTGLLEPVLKETTLGRAEVRDTFRIKGVGTIAGCRVVDGAVKRDAEVRVVRDGVVVYTGRVQSLKRFKEDANEVRSGFECGVGITNFNDVKVGDVLECFSVERVAALASA